MAWTYHAQRALTNDWLDHDLGLTDTALTWQLTGPGELTATVDAKIAGQIASDNRFLFDEWSTLIYAEDESEEIRWGGILTNSTDIGGGARSLRCESFSGYPTGRIYELDRPLDIPDAFDIVREIWEYVQSDEYGNLNVIVSEDKANFLVGNADPGPLPVQNPGESSASFDKRIQDWRNVVNTPYELAWWNTPDLGNEINSLMELCGGDYLERHAWSNNKQFIGHFIDLFPNGRISRRGDLRFYEGENIKVAPQPERDGSAYANYVKGLGVGTERDSLHSEVRASFDGRLRRDAVYPAKDLMNQYLLDTQTSAALYRAQDLLKFDSVEVVDHPNAPIGSWNLGDEILIQTFSGYEKLNEWMRITEWTFSPDNPDSATLRLVRSNGA